MGGTNQCADQGGCTAAGTSPPSQASWRPEAHVRRGAPPGQTSRAEEPSELTGLRGSASAERRESSARPVGCGERQSTVHPLLGAGPGRPSGGRSPSRPAFLVSRPASDNRFAQFLFPGHRLWPPIYLHRDKGLPGDFGPTLGQTAPAGRGPARRGAWHHSPHPRASKLRQQDRPGICSGFSLSPELPLVILEAEPRRHLASLPGAVWWEAWVIPGSASGVTRQRGLWRMAGSHGQGSAAEAPRHCVLWAQSRRGFSGLAPCQGMQPGRGASCWGPRKPGGQAGPGVQGMACVPGAGPRPRP